MNNDVYELAQLVRAEANRVTRRASILRKLSARLVDAVEAAEEKNDSPNKEDTRNDRFTKDKSSK